MQARLGLRRVAASGFALLLLAAADAGATAASARPGGDGALAGIASAAGSALVEPDHDPFYRPPAGFEATSPGTVLATRPVTVTGLGLPVPVDSRQFLVRSSDAQGAPTAVVGTLMVPRTPSAIDPRPLVSYQPATDSLGDQCNPSYKLRAGTEYELPLMMQALQLGWAVVVTDYQGPENAFGAGRMAGHAVLDGIRAAIALAGTGLAGTGLAGTGLAGTGLAGTGLAGTGLAGAATPVGLWGYSGGGLATSWAAELQPGYAPELDVAGAASGGTPADLEAAARQIDGTAASGLLMLASTGLSRAYPAMLTLLNDAGREMVRRIGDMCVGDAVSAFPFRHLNEFTTSPDPLSEPSAQTVLELNHLGRQTPAAPVFLYHSVFDELIPFRSAQALQADWCRAGGRVTFHADTLSTHSSLAATGAPLAVGYLASRFAGVDVPTTCP